MRSGLSLFLVCTLVFWALASGVAFLLWPEQRPLSLAYSAAAGGLCLLPSLLTLAWALAARDPSPEMRRLLMLGGTGVRMFFVLGAALLLTSTVGYFHRQSFWVWLLVFYLATLALEMVVLVRALGGPGKRRSTVP